MASHCAKPRFYLCGWVLEGRAEWGSGDVGWFGRIGEEELIDYVGELLGVADFKELCLSSDLAEIVVA